MEAQPPNWYMDVAIHDKDMNLDKDLVIEEENSCGLFID